MLKLKIWATRFLQIFIHAKHTKKILYIFKSNPNKSRNQKEIIKNTNSIPQINHRSATQTAPLSPSSTTRPPQPIITDYSNTKPNILGFD